MAFTKETLAHLIGEFRGIDREAGGGLPAGPCVCTAPRSSAPDPAREQEEAAGGLGRRSLGPAHGHTGPGTPDVDVWINSYP